MSVEEEQMRSAKTGLFLSVESGEAEVVVAGMPGSVAWNLARKPKESQYSIAANAARTGLYRDD